MIVTKISTIIVVNCNDNNCNGNDNSNPRNTSCYKIQSNKWNNYDNSKVSIKHSFDQNSTISSHNPKNKKTEWFLDNEGTSPYLFCQIQIIQLD